jgi:microcystin degradation protein MlrC
MRVFTGSLATETNTFAPMPTGLSAFRERGYYPAGTHPDQMTQFAGPLWAARERVKSDGWTLIEGLVAGAQPSGTTTRSAYETLRDELLGDLKAALPVDLVVLGLHGAMIADGYDDCEGDLLERVRRIVGPKVIVGAELDPHNHLTAAMIDNADLLVAYKEYPHTDILERARELVDLCAQTVEGRIKPVAAVVDCHMLVRMHTSRQPARGFVDRIMALEGKEDVLSISVTHGFPWGDTPELGTKMLVYTNDLAPGAKSRGEALARKLADELVSQRDDLDIPMPGIDEALDQALGFPGGPVVISDGADNAGGGAASDSTFFLRRMLERGIGNAALGPLWDPVAARIAFDAGPGAQLTLRVGGKVSAASGDPVDAECRVKAVRKDMVMTGLSNTRAPLGDCALVEIGGIEIVLNTIRVQAVDTDLFTQLGCDLAAKKIVVVKSSQHFYASYSKVAKHVIYAAAPGSVTADLTTLPYKKLRRKVWPVS